EKEKWSKTGSSGHYKITWRLQINKVKKVLYLSYDGMTDPLGQSQVIPYLQGLSKLGYQFTILSFEKKEKLEKNGDYIRSLLDDSGIKWEPQIFSKRPPVLAKLYDIWKLNKAVLRLHKKEQFLFTHCRSYIAAGAGLKLLKKYQVPFLFDIRGFWVDERIDNGQWNRGNPVHNMFYKIYKKKERDYFNRARHIISLTWKGEQELINGYKVPADKITVIPCCVDLNHFDYKKITPEIIAAKKKELNIGEKHKVITYLGSFGGWYLLKEMFDFFLQLKKKLPEVKFLFITQSSFESVLNAANSCGADINDIIVQPASRNEVPVYLSLSDWSIFFIKNGYSKMASSPTKQGEIMAMGIPIICNDVGDTGKIIEESGVGLVVHSFEDGDYNRVISNMDQLNLINKEHIRQSAFTYYDLTMGVERYSAVYRNYFS
ncbi:MAG: glycosyltransferase family 4 protein, partial [Chitinophagaceae bacterium]|nr:glycosyltransferase family 4 protein [Chitinophagaceae bacterium]